MSVYRAVVIGALQELSDSEYQGVERLFDDSLLAQGMARGVGCNPDGQPGRAYRFCIPRASCWRL